MKKCNDCGRCCEFGSGFLAEDDKEKIASFLKITIKQLEAGFLEKTIMFGTEAWRPKFSRPFGRCIFFSEEKHCTIHDVKPALCRLANCREDATGAFYKKYFVKSGKGKDKFESERIKQSQDEWSLRERIKNGE
jgi:Fe-S-cluster containining protein